MLTRITSPMLAYRRFEPPSTLIHITARAPVLSATSSTVCIWIILHLQLVRPNHLRAGSFGSRPGAKNAAKSTRNHDVCQPILGRPCLFEQPRYPPRLGPRQRTALLDQHQIALAALVLFVVRVVFLRACHDLSVHRMGDATLHQNGHGLVHLVADDSAGQHAGCLALGHFAFAFSLRMVLARAMSRRTFFS